MKQFEEELLKDDWTGKAGSGSEEDIDSGRRGDLHSVPYRRPQGERESDPASFFGSPWKMRSSVWAKPSRRAA
jgi:hypothetical protein